MQTVSLLGIQSRCYKLGRRQSLHEFNTIHLIPPEEIRWMKQRILTSTLIALLAFLLIGRIVTADGARAIWAVNDGEKIEQDDLNAPQKRGNSVWDGKRIKLFGARNEIIAFQLIVEADASGIKQLSATLPEFKRKGSRHKILYSPPGTDPSQTVGRPIQLFSVNYLNVTRATGASW